MKKLNVLTRMLLLVALLVGSTNVKAVTADVTYDFTGSGWSVSGSNPKTLTNGTVSFTGYGGSNFKMNDGYFYMGKSGAYLTFPTYSSPVSKIVVTGNSGASASVVQNIFVGTTAVSTATTGATGTNTYNIASGYQAAGTTYTLKVTSSHNTQITKIEVFYASAYTINTAVNDANMGSVSLNGTTITASPNTGYRVKSGVEGYTVTSGTATVTHEGYSNTLSVSASSNCTVQINFEAIPTHTLNTAVSPSASGSVELASSTVAEGATTTATASPAAGYKFTSWSITGTGATLSSTTDNPTTVTMGTADATITANFDEATTYPITYSVNGNTIIKNVEENKSIDFSAPESGIPSGYIFKGWVVEANKIDTPTDSDPSANYVTSATCKGAITYYAVMAVETPTTVTLTASHTTNNTTYDDHNYTDDADNTWSGNTNEPYEDKVARIGLRSTSGSYLESPTFDGNVTAIKIMTYNGSSSDRTFNILSAKTSGTTYGTVTAPKQTKLTAEQTATLGNTAFKKFFIIPSEALGFSYIKVTYGQASNYCTTVPTATVTLAAACNDGEETPTYYGTYSNDKAFVVPADMTVSTIKVADSKLVVTAYDEGDIVKAGTGVMVSSATSGAHTITLAAGGSEVEGNMLYASGDAGIDADGMAAIVDDCKYYRLTMHGYEAGVNPGVIGYYWGTADGAAFALAANKAFLAVPTALAKEGFSISFDDDNNDDPSGETTAIAGVDAQQNAGTAYNLAGQRVGKDYKGIVIVNGKKYVRK